MPGGVGRRTSNSFGATNASSANRDLKLSEVGFFNFLNNRRPYTARREIYLNLLNKPEAPNLGTAPTARVCSCSAFYLWP